MATARRLAISIAAKDRPGIVAEVAGLIAEWNGNLADLRETVLDGYFTMILMAELPADHAPEELERHLTARTGARVAVMPCETPSPAPPDLADTYVLSASGPDRTGLVAQVAAFCRDRAVNILDFASRTADGRYLMTLLVDLSRTAGPEALRPELDRLAEGGGLHLGLRHYDVFRATNEIQKPLADKP